MLPRRVRAGLSVALLLVFFAVPAKVSAQLSDANEQTKIGGQRYNAGDLEGAITAFRKADALRPNDPVILFSLAQALGDRGSFHEAETIYLRCVPLYEQLQSSPARKGGPTLKPNIAIAWNNLAALYTREKRFEEARTTNERALAVWPVPASVPSIFFVTRALILDGLNYPEDAAKAYAAALSRDPRNADALLDYGIFLTAHGHAADATAVLRNGTVVSPQDPDMFSALGNALTAQNLWSDAAAAWQKSSELRPDDPAVLYNLGNSFRQLHRTAEALDALEKAQALAPNDPAIASSLSALRVETGTEKQPSPLITVQARKALTTADAYALALSLEQQGNTAEALPLIQGVLQERPDFPQGIALLAALNLDIDKIADAKKIIDPALAAHPDSPELHNTFGLLLFAQRRFPEAIGQFEKALALRSEYQDAEINHAVALSRMSRGDEAVPELEKALQQDPRNLKALADLGIILMDLHRYTEASAAFAQAIEVAPHQAELYANLGTALQKAGHAADANKAFANAKRVRAGDSPLN